MLKQGLDSDANNIKAENAIDIEITPVISKLKEILSQANQTIIIRIRLKMQKLSKRTKRYLCLMKSSRNG